MKADLHIHCSASFDATESVDTILRLAREQQLDLIAISDHNEIDGALELETKASAVGIETLRGIEIDCFSAAISVHLLGLWLRSAGAGFAALKESLHRGTVAHREARLDADRGTLRTETGRSAIIARRTAAVHQC